MILCADRVLSTENDNPFFLLAVKYTMAFFLIPLTLSFIRDFYFVSSPDLPKTWYLLQWWVTDVLRWGDFLHENEKKEKQEKIVWSLALWWVKIILFKVDIFSYFLFRLTEFKYIYKPKLNQFCGLYMRHEMHYRFMTNIDLCLCELTKNILFLWLYFSSGLSLFPQQSFIQW